MFLFNYIKNRYVNVNCVIGDIKLIIKLIVIIKLLFVSFNCDYSVEYFKLLLSF